MKIANKSVQKLLKHYKEIYLLGRINSLLSWDLNVNLPIKAAKDRAEQSAYLANLLTDKWLDKDFMKTLEGVDANSGKLTLQEKGVLRNLAWEAKYYFTVPKAVIIEFAQVSSESFLAWMSAKDTNDFKKFEPYLNKLVDLNKSIAANLGYAEESYDALLNIYEPGLTAGNLRKMFSRLKPELTRILKSIQSARGYRSPGILADGGMIFPQEAQKKVAEFVLNKMGYDFAAGRMDVSSHPFTDTLARRDVRITNRYKPTDFRESLMVAMHEGGHALYEQGISDAFTATPLGGGVSLGIHESQSRFWENQVGRSKEFLDFIYPTLRAFYPRQFSKITKGSIYGLFNTVTPSLIRTEADEVTYNLHIIIRFEIEEALITDKIKVKDLPDVWREKMKKYIGIVPRKDSQGVLQDIHWSHMPFGYFPTYTLGNLYAAQFSSVIKKTFNLSELLAKGELATILSWLRENIHKYGGLYWPNDLVKKVSGEDLSEKFFLEYLKEKYSKIYSVKL